MKVVTFVLRLFLDDGVDLADSMVLDISLEFCNVMTKIYLIIEF